MVAITAEKQIRVLNTVNHVKSAKMIATWSRKQCSISIVYANPAFRIFTTKIMFKYRRLCSVFTLLRIKINSRAYCSAKVTGSSWRCWHFASSLSLFLTNRCAETNIWFYQYTYVMAASSKIATTYARIDRFFRLAKTLARKKITEHGSTYFSKIWNISGKERLFRLTAKTVVYFTLVFIEYTLINVTCYYSYASNSWSSRYQYFFSIILLSRVEIKKYTNN